MRIKDSLRTCAINAKHTPPNRATYKMADWPATEALFAYSGNSGWFYGRDGCGYSQKSGLSGPGTSHHRVYQKLLQHSLFLLSFSWFTTNCLHS